MGVVNGRFATDVLLVYERVFDGAIAVFLYYIPE